MYDIYLIFRRLKLSILHDRPPDLQTSLRDLRDLHISSNTVKAGREEKHRHSDGGQIAGISSMVGKS
jgi:hypothetical protein